MFGFTSRRSAVLIAAVCVGLGAGAVLAVQASATGRKSTAPSSPTSPPIRPLTASGKLSPEVLATNAHCGQTLTASLTLNGDLQCSGNGLIVTGTSHVLNLNGHAIFGPGSGSFSGVELLGTSDTVENGTVTGFSYGVYVQGITDTVLNVRSAQNTFSGIENDGSGSKITNSMAVGNTGYGIDQPTSATGTYSGDHELNNGVNGLVVVGKVTITSNVANGNRSYGIYDTGFGTTLTKNTASFNGLDGIYVAAYDAAVIDGGGNTAKGNDYGSGATPEQCRGVVCS
jgi:hypothetical protein